ncbi:Na+/H+ antiporter subunit D [Alkalihalobacillus pseudalcaliphilus]|uniref:Na+/H+ antiporter subunit D n=1 Tax=Alkalihalobacillus pseudalcaliphilus TaxID=79884 RepID=UPI00064DC5A2|nr:Na+/H+ antiporter subunit D [Alkalihalobacillus pseudalcaliphilus]KMK75914.1 monovalent cation/H+ antiporter subunit D [Alkalihalobacillus pseudalcaliphilus]
MSNLIVFPLLIPFLAAIILLFIRKSVTAERILSIIAGIATILVSGWLVIDVYNQGVISYAVGGWDPPFGIALVADPLSALLVLFASIVVFVCVLFSIKGIDEVRVKFYFYPLVQFLLLGVIGAFLTGDIFNLFVFFEVLLMASYGLITLGGSRAQLQESIKYVLINVISSAFFIAAVAYLYAVVGTLNIAHLSERVAEIGQPGIVTVIAFLFLIVFGMKAAIFPLYFWLPGSYSAPPPVITALFAGLLTKVGIYAIMRIFTIIFHHQPQITHMVLEILAILTMVVGVIGAVAYNDMQKVVVYNVVAGVGFIIFGISSFNEAGLFGAGFYLLHDMLIKAALFLLIGAIMIVTQTSSMKNASGLIKQYPLLGWSFLIAALSLAGIPPFSGFFGKLYLFQGGIEAGQYISVIIMIFVSLLLLYSVMRIFFNVVLGEENHASQNEKANIKGLLYPSMILLFLSFVMGFGAEFFVPHLTNAAEVLLNPEIYIEAVLKE